MNIKNTLRSNHRRDLGRLEGLNRYGENHIKHDSRQDLIDPLYEDEYGMRHLRDDRQSFESNWSKDSRSEAFRENHFGKGPKGYKRSDELIFEEACDALAIDRHLDATFMEMEVKDGCIYLRGEATSRDDKRLAEEIVEHIMGVSDVQNQLIVRKNSTSPLQHRSLAENESGGLLRGLT